MLKNYLKTAFRNLTRNKTYTLINISGLTLGITCALMIFLIERFELSFDRFHAKADRIFRINTDTHVSGSVYHTGGTCMPLGPAVKNEIALVKKVTVVYSTVQGLISVSQPNGTVKKIKETKGVAFIDPVFFEMFDFSWVAGDPKVLSEPGNVVLTETMARKYFGNDDPIGRTIRFDNVMDLKVAGLVEDFPNNSLFPFTVIVSFSSLKQTSNAKRLEDWRDTNSNANTFIVIDPEDAGAVEKQVEEVRKKYVPNPQLDFRKLTLQPLLETHFDTRYEAYNGHQIGRTSLWALAFIGFLILLTACFNFINMATAQAVNRMKEIGVRKVLGAARKQLIVQFLGETLLVTACAAFLSLVLAELILNDFNIFFGVQLSSTALQSAPTWMVLMALILTVGVLSGLYPAVVLSGFRPAAALKGKLMNALNAKWSVRKMLVVGQFVVSQVLVIGTLVVTYQMNYFETRDMGFLKEAVFTVPLPNNDAIKLNTLRTQWLTNESIENVSFSYNSASSDEIITTSFSDFKNGEVVRYLVEMKPSDAHFLATYGLELAAGRNLTESDTMSEIIINETLVRRMGLTSSQDAIGHILKYRTKQLPIVGVVKDFHTQSLHTPVEPCVLGTVRSSYQLANIRINPANLSKGVEHVEQAWNRSFPEYVYEGSFLDQRIRNFYGDEQRMLTLFRAFASIAIFIGALGLFGLVSYIAERRTKEIGIRKVVGATAKDIMWIFGKEFGGLLLTAFVFSAPAGYVVMNRWLEGFAYRIKIGPEIFIPALFSSIILVAVSVGYRSVKAATANPVEALKYE